MKNQLLENIAEFPVIPVFYHPEPETALNVVSCCYEGGMRVFEFTNRGEKSIEVFHSIIENRNLFPGMQLGIGTIMDKEQARQFIDLGADFIVSPILDFEVAQICSVHQKPWIPGCGTLTEVINADRAGAGLVKVFPGNVLGPGFIKSVLGPCPQLKLMPTGGVTPASENLKEWFGAGAFSVGIGSSLFNKEIIKPENRTELLAKILEIKHVLEEIPD